MSYNINEVYRWLIALFSLIMLFIEFLIFNWLKNNKLNIFKLIFSLIISTLITWLAIPDSSFTCDSYNYDWCDDYSFVGVITIISDSNTDLYGTYKLLNNYYSCKIHHFDLNQDDLKNNQFLGWRKSDGYTTCVSNSYAHDYFDHKNDTNRTYMNLLIIFGLYVIISNLILLFYYQIYIPYFTTSYDIIDSDITENILVNDTINKDKDDEQNKV